MSGWAGRALNLLVTAAVGPGIASHEGAHHLACRLVGVEVTGGDYLNPFGGDAYLDHEPVDSLPVDVAIAFAPLVVNTALALAAFALAAVLGTPAAYLPLWLGVCFGLTAFPSDADTDGFLRNARNLPAVARPLGYLVAVPLWAATRSALVTGVYAFFWTGILYAVAGRLPTVVG